MRVLVQPRNGTRFRPAFDDAAAFRRAVSVWLEHRFETVRDVVSVRLPRPEEGIPVADFILFARGRTRIVALLTVSEILGHERERFGHLLETLAHEYCIVRAETPAHAVAQVAELVCGDEKGAACGD